MLTIKNVFAKAGDTEVLKGLDLTINAGEVHAIMGPNGAGKSTLGNVLAGMPHISVDSGEIDFLGKDLLELEPEERAAEGIFLAFQYPVEIPGVNNMYFLRTAFNAQRKYHGLEEMDAAAFLRMLKEKVKQMNMRDDLLKRPLNVGFSGGEKKRNEVFQMGVLEPKLAILDETDSGLDIDALKIVADGVNQLRAKDRSFMIITHYQRLLNYIEPDFVHVLADGKIVKSGDKNLALELEEHGYGWLYQ